MDELRTALNKEAINIADFCAACQCTGTFKFRSFYGVAYAAALWASYLDRFNLNTASALEWLHNNEGVFKQDHDAHWEFLNYGMLRAGDVPFSHYHNNTRVVNWQLLKLLDEVLAGRCSKEGPEVIHILKLIESVQQEDGFIPDFVTPGSIEKPSHQYHNFSTCLLGELVEAGCTEFNAAFHRGVSYIKLTAGKLGDINFRGRGAGQIKGYAAGIFALVYSGEYDIANKVLNYIVKFKREDEPYPLVLSVNEPHYTQINGHGHSHIFGWESYNNYFDYIPLAGWYFRKAANTLC